MGKRPRAFRIPFIIRLTIKVKDFSIKLFKLSIWNKFSNEYGYCVKAKKPNGLRSNYPLEMLIKG
jgi:hypothetical protein